MKNYFLNPATGLLIVFLLVFGSACQQRITYPAISGDPEAAPEPGGIVWRDLVTPDPAAAQRFYGAVFGWTFETLGDGAYTVIKHEGDPIGGIFPMPVAARANSTAEWVVSISVADVSTATKAIVAAGGEIVASPQKLRGRGFTSVVADPQGAIFSIIAVERDTEASSSNNEWLWTELWSNDIDASVGFYEGITGLDAREIKDDTRDYFLFEDGETKLAGMIKNPMQNTRTHWVPYVRVSDPSAIADKVQNAGGTVLAGPSPALRNGNVVVIMDPSGAHFVAQRRQAD